MANDLNQVTMTGRLGKDPEIRSIGNGDKVANFTLAVGEQWRTKDGERKEKTEWVSVVAWGGLVKVIEGYVKKGSKVLVQGKLQTRKWEKDGKTNYTTEVVLQGFDAKLLMLDSKPSEQREERQQSGYADRGGYAQSDDSEIPF